MSILAAVMKCSLYEKELKRKDTIITLSHTLKHTRCWRENGESIRGERGAEKEVIEMEMRKLKEGERSEEGKEKREKGDNKRDIVLNRKIREK